MIDQDKIHNQCLSDDPEERSKALKQLKDNFSLMPDKQKAWSDLIRLNSDENSYVRKNAFKALDYAFPHLLDEDKQKAWSDIIKLAIYRNSSISHKIHSIRNSVFPSNLYYNMDNYFYAMENAIKALGFVFLYVPDKQKAWNDLIKLTNDQDEYVRANAIKALGFVFPYVPDKQKAWNDLIKLAEQLELSRLQYISDVITKNDNWNYLQRLSVKILTKDNFNPPDIKNCIHFVYSEFLFTGGLSKSSMQQKWNYLHKSSYNDFESRSEAFFVLASAFSYLSDKNKQKAWSDLIKLAIYEETWMMSGIVGTLGSMFFHLPNEDKQKAWKNLHGLLNREIILIESEIIDVVISIFPYLSDEDKQEAWEDLHKLTVNKDNFVRSYVATAIGSIFSDLTDANRREACEDLRRLIVDKDDFVRSNVATSIGSIFFDLTAEDKQVAREYLRRLIIDEDDFVRSNVASSIGSIFSDLIDEGKQQAWEDLHRLMTDKSEYVRGPAIKALKSAFPHVPDEDKREAWNYLIKLMTYETDYSVTSDASESLGSVFHYLSDDDKQKAWSDLIKLTTCKPYLNICSLCYAFPYVLEKDKQQAWDYLHKLTIYKDSIMRSEIAKALSFAFPYVAEEYKQQMWNDLNNLATDESHSVRIYANHSLGKISIFKASQAEKEECYKSELETAISFFEKAAEETEYKNPSYFCLPFYRSLYTIIFKEQESQREVDKYLAEARDAVKGSKDKKLLLEAVENLANALREVQNLGNLGFEAKKEEINFYRKYCDRAAELMSNIDEKAPAATEVLRKGLPILDRNLKGILEEIQEKAKIVCKISKGKDAEKIACAVNEEIQKLEIGNQEELNWYMSKILIVLKSKIPHTPENKEILDMIESITHERDLVNKYRILLIVVGLIPTIDGVREDLILHIGPITPYGGIEYALTIPVERLSDPQIQKEVSEIAGKRISQLSMLPKKLRKIVEDDLVKRDYILNNLR